MIWNFTVRPRWQRYTFAIVAAAAAIRAGFPWTLGTTHSPFAPLYPAVMIAALFGNFLAGFLATVLSALLAAYSWAAPGGRFAVADPANWARMIDFVNLPAFT